MKDDKTEITVYQGPKVGQGRSWHFKSRPPAIFNDTWPFNIATRKWTQPQLMDWVHAILRKGHPAVLVGDVMYVFGGCTIDGTQIGDLTAII